MLSVEDKMNINELISLHGHLADSGRLDEFDKVFSKNVTYDLTPMAGGKLNGVEGMRAAALALGDKNPVGHHVTNVIISEGKDGTVRASSKAIGIRADGSCGSLVYDDILTKQEGEWRISYRKVTMRRVPLHG